MASHLGDHLEKARQRRFVGRIAERELFRSALAAAELPFVVLHVFGPSGIGKTSLLREFVHIAAQLQVHVVYLDGRNVGPDPDPFLAALRKGLGEDGPDMPLQFLAAAAGRAVLLIDTAELLAPLDGWLRDVFLPGLPGNVLVVMAGRHPPSLAWRTDPGWQTMMRVLPLRNLTEAESRAYLLRRQVPVGEHEAVLDFTHGHPLALSLVADVLAQRPGVRFQPQEAPDVIKTLLEKFIEKAPGPVHRAALEVCALVRLTTESLLSELLEPADVRELFDWLRQLSFIEAERHGIFPHDLARDALTADLRWRNPDWYAELHRRARNYYMAHVQEGDEEQQRRALSHYFFLHRENPVIRPYFEWQETGTVFADAMHPGDEPALVAMVHEHEGEAAAQLAAHWLAQQPGGVTVIRHASGQPQGFLARLVLERVTPAERELDPAVAACWRYLQDNAPLRPGETAALFRFWMARDTYQAVSPVQSRIFLDIIHQYLTTPALAYTFLACADPDFWSASFAYAELDRTEAADFMVGGRHYGVYGHDWRVLPPLAWLELTAHRELAGGSAVNPLRPPQPLRVFDELDFATAVREALRHVTEPYLLRENPLLQSRLVADQVGANSDVHARVAALQTLLQNATAALQQSPRQTKFFLVLQATYFQPVTTQELAAERLDLPFSTYRRHLRAGIELVTERLWQQELGQAIGEK